MCQSSLEAGLPLSFFGKKSPPPTRQKKLATASSITMKKRLVFFCVVAVYSAFVGMASSVNSASYDEPTAIKAVYLSAAAYCREPLITAWNCSFCKEQFPQFQLRAPVFYGTVEVE
jgi:hypothetical protein